MPRTANRSGGTTPRRSPAAKNTDDAVLEALNADRAAPDHSQQRQDRQRGDAREAEGIEEGSLPEEPARSRPTQ